MNWALLIFFLQLIILPLMITFLGPSLGSLTALPSNFATNMSLLLSTFGYVVFCATYELVSARYTSEPSEHGTTIQWMPSRAIVLLNAALGITGLALNFGSVGDILSYFTSSQTNELLDTASSATLRTAAPLFLKPFLGFAFVMIWCMWVDRYGRTSTRIPRLLVTGGLAMLVALVYATFSFNRGAFVFPLIAMISVYLSRVRRIPIKVLISVSFVAILLMAFSGFRNGSKPQEVGTNNAKRVSNFQHAPQFDFNEQVQVYGVAPQFGGYLFEQTNYARKPYWGGTLLPSILSPIPILGKPFRDSSGATIYNNLIYGPVGIADIPLSLQGELFINFQIAGVAVGFLILGYMVARLQRAFAQAATALETYIWMYTSVWTIDVILLGLSPVSQIFVYFFWPVYGYFLLRSVRSYPSHRHEQ
ncbi:MAG: hypothetical protein ACR2PL_13415 [Dehalococcoidia bacterium]